MCFSLTDSSNCYGCGNVCGTGQTCDSDQQKCTCKSDEHFCDGKCVSITDTSNCYACGIVCGIGQTCDSTSMGCTCGDQAQFCNNSCVSKTDQSNCLECNKSCDSAQNCTAQSGCHCTAGGCQSNCPDPNMIVCDGSCVDPSSDPNHCGGCTACASGPSGRQDDCFRGQCVPSNDKMSNAQVIDLGTTLLGQRPVAGTTTNATTSADRGDPGPDTSCVPSSDVNVWYKITTTKEELIYADTIGSAVDTKLYFTFSNGAPISVPAGIGVACNDDACGTQGAQVALNVGPDTYYLVVASPPLAATSRCTSRTYRIRPTTSPSQTAA